jgi:uncharacterized protein YdaU (DUF1376 family)
MTDTPIWMPLNVADFIKDTQHLDADELGGYVSLLCQCWLRGGELPCDEKFLRKVAKFSPHRWRVAGPVLLAFFALDDGVYRHKRITQELGKAAVLIEMKRAAGKASAAKRAQQPFNGCSTDVGTGGQQNANQSQSQVFLTGGGAADPKSIIFTDGLALLTSTGSSAGSARSLLGKWCKSVGDARLATLIGEAMDKGVVDPRSWIAAAVAKPANDQDAFLNSVIQRFGVPAVAAQ